ncbi:MAG: hemolysin family protein [Chloroflexota bacterium]
MLISIASLILIDALITVGYAALQNARESDLREHAENGRSSAQTALTLLDNKSQLYITYILTNTLLLTGVIVISVAWLIAPQTPILEQPIAILSVFGIGFLALMLGTVVPESIGSAYANALVPIFATPLRLINLLLIPITSIFLGLSYLLARLFGSDKLVNTVTEEEIMTLVNAGNSGGTIEDEEREMIFSILQLDETYAREIMIPRIDIEAVEMTTTLDIALDQFMRTGYSRMPVYEDNVDNIIGLLYAKDLLNMWGNGGLQGHTAKDLVRSAYYVPETRTADNLLRDMQARNIHMAIVVDEYGGTSGLVTIENIMEEIVGDIRDEYDLNEENEYIQQNDDEFVIDAGMDVDDVNELLGTSINSDDSDTLGGYIFLQIGRVPIVGEAIDTDELHLTVRSIEGRRIRKVLVKVKPPVTEDDNTDSDESENDETPAELADAS